MSNTTQIDNVNGGSVVPITATTEKGVVPCAGTENAHPMPPKNCLVQKMEKMSSRVTLRMTAIR